MTTGTELTTFVTSLNAEATIDPVLLASLVQTAQAVIEEERPWMSLRKTDPSLSVTTSNTWQTAKSFSGITGFSRFYGDIPIKLFDGTSRIERYRLVPFDRRLEYKDVSNTACYDYANGNLYLNGTVPFAGTLYISYVSASTAIDVTTATAVWSAFPSRFLPLVGYYATGIYKGAVDYDSINKLMLPTNAATLQALKNAMEKWDDNLQLSDLEHNDPTESYGHPRSGAINRNDTE